jgi:hypothetical protein
MRLSLEERPPILYLSTTMIGRLPRWLLLAVALVLCGQSALAAAHCLRLSASSQHAPFHVEICTVDGIVLMDLGEGADHQAPAGDMPAGFCPVCHGLPHVTLPEPVLVASPDVSPVAASIVMPEATPPHRPRAPPYAPRGPPHHS